MSLEWLKPVDLWFWVFLSGAGLILGWSFFSLRRHPGFKLLLGLRTVTILILLVVWLQPRVTWRQVQTRTLNWKAYLDNSVSMRYHQTPSLPAINSGTQDFLDQLAEKGLTPAIARFAGDIIEEEAFNALDASGASTDLGRVLARIRTEQAGLAGAVLITDGQPTQGEDPLQLVNALSIPLLIIGVGHHTPLVDVAVKSVDAPTVTVKGEALDVEVLVQSLGRLDDRINVTLSRGKKLIGSRPVRVRGGGSRNKVQFRFKPAEIGRLEYQVQVSSLEEEINIQNNRLNFQVQVLKDRYRVALLTGSPNVNTGVIKQYLRHHPRISLDHYVQFDRQTVRPPLKSFWETAYDLIVFDNFPSQKLSSNWQRILAKKLLANRSALAWVMGPNVTLELAQGLLPFFHLKSVGEVLEKKAYPWYLSERFAATVPVPLPEEDQDFPPLKASLQLENGTGAVESLAYLAAPVQIPLLVRGEKEGLRSLVWTSNELAPLHYKLTATDQADFLLHLWQGLLTWLLRTGGEDELYFRLNKDSYQQGEAILVTGSRVGSAPDGPAGARVTLTVFRGEEKVNSVELHYNLERSRWDGQIWASHPGAYSYEIVLAEGSRKAVQRGTFTVTESQIELNRIYLNESLLRQLAERSGGRYVTWPQRLELLERMEAKEQQKIVTKGFKLNEVKWLIAVVVVFLTVEWVLRRRLGLP